MAKLDVDVQLALADRDLSHMSEQKIDMWANLAYDKASGLLGLDSSHVTVRLVDEPEMTQLNYDFRGKNKTTNVLSFPFENDFPELVEEFESMESGLSELGLLGDVVICHSVIAGEAKAQGKSTNDHYAHMVVHGILHLCGYDHQDEVSAHEMESLEIEILAQHEVANPYR